MGEQNGTAAVSNGNSAFNLREDYRVGVYTLQRPEGREGLGDICLQQQDPLSGKGSHHPNVREKMSKTFRMYNNEIIFGLKERKFWAMLYHG